MLIDSQLGVQHAGQVLRAPETSAISGQKLEAGDAFISFDDSAYTIGIRGHEWRRMSATEKEAVKVELRKQFPAEPSTVPVAETNPLDTLNAADLDALAQSEGIDLKGRRSNTDKVSAITAARVIKRLGGSLPAADAKTESEAT